MTYTVRPLSDHTWLRPESQRIGSQFRSSWPETETLLQREVEYLGGKNLVIEIDISAADLRLDGTLRANARSATPAVVVAFEAQRYGPMLFQADTFTTYGTLGWQHNVRGVAKTLENLRAIKRYGATDTGQQYTGFKALPAGRAMPASHMTSDEAVAILSLHSQFGIAEVRPNLTTAIRQARARTHPDAHAGDRGQWDRVEQAAAVLGVS